MAMTPKEMLEDLIREIRKALKTSRRLKLRFKKSVTKQTAVMPALEAIVEMYGDNSASANDVDMEKMRHACMSKRWSHPKDATEAMKMEARTVILTLGQDFDEKFFVDKVWPGLEFVQTYYGLN